MKNGDAHYSMSTPIAEKGSDLFLRTLFSAFLQLSVRIEVIE
jgi:hypothetical protein